MNENSRKFIVKTYGETQENSRKFIDKIYGETRQISRKFTHGENRENS